MTTTTPRRIAFLAALLAAAGVPHEVQPARVDEAEVKAALAAEGTSTLHNVRQVERGYQNLHRRLRDLGADVERIEE